MRCGYFPLHRLVYHSGHLGDFESQNHTSNKSIMAGTAIHSLCRSYVFFTLLTAPVCVGCDKRLTIEHILLTGSDFIEIRESHFTAKSLRMLFKDISPEKIF